MNRQRPNSPRVLVALQAADVGQWEGLADRLVGKHAAVNRADADRIEPKPVGLEKTVGILKNVFVRQAVSAFRVEETRCLFDREAESRQELQELRALLRQRSESLAV